MLGRDDALGDDAVPARAIGHSTVTCSLPEMQFMPLTHRLTIAVVERTHEWVLPQCTTAPGSEC